MVAKKLRIYGFLGSPRRKGNTATLLEAVLREARKRGHETELIHLMGRKISGCVECFACQKVMDEPGCAIKDDMQEMFPKMLSADRILLATPVFDWSFSWLMKAFLDRTYCLAKYAEDGTYTSLLEGKKCGLLVTAAGDEFDGADLVVEAYRRIVEYHRMEYIGHIVVGNVNTGEDVLRPGIKRKIKEFVKNML